MTSYSYPKNIDDCIKGPSQGGLAMGDLKDLATKMGIDVTGLKKADICKEIKKSLGGKANIPIAPIKTVSKTEQKPKKIGCKYEFIENESHEVLESDSQGRPIKTSDKYNFSINCKAYPGEKDTIGCSSNKFGKCQMTNIGLAKAYRDLQKVNKKNPGMVNKVPMMKLLKLMNKMSKMTPLHPEYPTLIEEAQTLLNEALLD